MSVPTNTKLGSVRAYAFGLLLATGGFMIGYDTGVVGGVLTFTSFQRDFQFGNGSNATISSLVVGLQQAGALLASLVIGPLANRLGRRRPLLVACSLFCIGVAMETVPSGRLALFYAGRIIAGLGIGSATTLVPVYMVEMSPKQIRGRLGSCIQWMFTWGVLTSYWVDYGVRVGLDHDPTMQWQIPIGLQMVPAAVLGIAMLFQPESVRWLAKKKRFDEARQSLEWIRADNSESVSAEFDEIIQGIEEEEANTQEFKKRELLEPANRHRVLLAFTLFVCQQCTGATALAYFGPQFFKLLVGGGTQNLLITGLFGVVKVLACGIFAFFFSERFGRKVFLLIGALGMGACMVIVAALDKTFTPPVNGELTGPGVAMVALIFLNIVFYNSSWGPLPWPYVSEIFPSRIREIGVSIGMSTQWLFNLIFSLVTPYMIAGMGWGTFLFYAALDCGIACFVYFCLQETRGLSLEQIDSLFRRDHPAYHGPAVGESMSVGELERKSESSHCVVVESESSARK